MRSVAGGSEQGRAGRGELDGAAAEGEDSRSPAGQAGDGFMSRWRKGGFTVAREDLAMVTPASDSMTSWRR